MTTTGALKLTTCDGKFFTGMKKNEIKTGKEIKLFDKIDTNKDGILQDKEICNYRDLESKENFWKGAVNSFAAIGGAVLLALPPYSTSSFELMGMAFLGGLAGHYFTEASDQNKITEQYRKEHNLQ